MCVPRPSANVGALNPQWMVFGDETFGRLLGSNEVIRVKPHSWDYRLQVHDLFPVRYKDKAE